MNLRKISAEHAYPVYRLAAKHNVEHFLSKTEFYKRGMDEFVLLVICNVEGTTKVFAYDMFFCSGHFTQKEETQSVSDTPQRRVHTYTIQMNAERFMRHMLFT